MPDTDDANHSRQSNPLAQFLTPEAMLTPGVAGSLTMMITNALTQNFAMPRAWVGLALSLAGIFLASLKGRSRLPEQAG